MRFDHCASTYDIHAAPQKTFAAKVATLISVSEATEILEFGAGTGALTKHLCGKAGARVRATDASSAMVAQGSRAVPEAEWFVLDAFAGPIPKSVLQVSSGLMQWAPDPIPVLHRWGEALLPGGRMIHSGACLPCLREWRELVGESPLRWRDPHCWRALFEAAGLRVVRSVLWTERHVFPSGHHMIRSLHRTGVTGPPLISGARLRRCIREYERLHRTPEGVSATWAWLAVEAVPE